jgi:hypothetical protein
MPSTFLTLKECERLTCFPDEIPQWDLITYFTLTEHDGSLIDTYQGEPNRLGVALQLCAVRYLGFCPADLHTASSDVTAFLGVGTMFQRMCSHYLLSRPLQGTLERPARTPPYHSTALKHYSSRYEMIWKAVE